MNILGSLRDMLPQFVTLVLRGILVSHFDYLPYNFDTNELPAKTYDFVVVGSGCGGSVVANRLSETTASVLVLEAGVTAPPESVIPGYPMMALNRDFFYNVVTEPERNTQLGFINNSAFAPVGRVIGGSTTVNGLVYVRGNKKDYDNWANMGNPGWDWQSVLPYFMKSENFQGQPLDGMEGHHHRGGPLAVQNRQIFSRAGKAFMDAGKELGYDLVDGSGPNQIGFSPMYGTIKAGVRHSASEAFLRPVIDRPNLDVRPNSMVTRVLFDKSKRAVGVEYMFKGKRHTVRANKEVIISAGALLTPKLLMLSGVGPRKHLEEMGIMQVAAVEGVGQNLNDHPIALMPMKVENYGGPAGARESFSITNLKNYITRAGGHLADAATVEANGWVYLGGGDPDWADVQITMAQLAPPNEAEEPLVVSNRLAQTGRNPETPDPNQEKVTISPFLSRPKSRGSVRLASKNPEDHPAVHFNWFDHPDDIKLFLRGIRMCEKIINSQAMQTSVQPVLIKALGTSCAELGFFSEEYWECYARHFSSTAWHYAGTAKMAPHTDPMGVVTPRLKVRGVSGLRVVDASIMPQIVSSNTMAPTYMIGEKAADMIKQDWGYPVDPLPVSNIDRRFG